MKKIFTGCLCLICFHLIAQQAKKYEVAITEIMADPSPVVGLPNAEYIEVRNLSSAPVDLFGWKISDATSTGTVTSHYILLPDSIAILCANSQAAALAAFGKSIGVSGFPSLDNDGDIISIRNSAFTVIHAIQYDLSWYRAEPKKEGGWSLEMIDIANPCTGSENWKASMNEKGGTPGKSNSVQSANPDVKPPALTRTFSPDSLSILLFFNEPVDSLHASATSNYQINSFAVLSATASPPLYNTILLKLSAPMEKERVYEVIVSNLTDCKGNVIGIYNRAKAGLAMTAKPRDLVINEILFDPASGAYDYVEIYNRGKAIIDLGNIYLANRDLNGMVASSQKLHAGPLCIFPGEFRVVTEDDISLAKHYLLKNPGNVIRMPRLPSYPDDKGIAVLLNQHGEIVDETAYSAGWHFALISNYEGISLERIDPEKPPEKSNWHSAASTAGYGTPGYQNSQFSHYENFDAQIAISPKIISPDNDGKDDILTIGYLLEEQGFLANVTIFDAAGRPVRMLVKNDLLAFKGSWSWDGLDEKKQQLPVGVYIILADIYNLKGKRKRFKEAVVLARRDDR